MILSLLALETLSDRGLLSAFRGWLSSAILSVWMTGFGR
jgi:hypothetical protein